MIASKKVSRRNFLKMLGAVVSYAFIPETPGRIVLPVAQPLVPVPPSLMLHSADGKPEFLPRLLECLQQDNFIPTTYQAWYRGVLTDNPIINPVILSMDDISLAQSGCARFNTFVQMKEWIQAAGATAVFGVVTEPVINDQPQRQQDEERWDRVQTWVEEGFELASHTSYHSNFNAVDTGPRPDFKAADYRAEIVQSAELIEVKLRERQIDYTVNTLILPYGSGYSYQQLEPSIHTGIIDACRQTHIKFVVGIPRGREPLPRQSFDDAHDISYVGRIPPAYLTDADNHHLLQAEQTASWLRAWQRNYGIA